MFTATLDGANELIARFEAMPATVMALVAAKTRALAIQLQALVVQKLSGEVLQVRTGALRRSIQEEVDQTETSVIATIFSAGDVKYAAIQNYGGVTPPHDIYPSKAEALAFMMGGQMVFAKVVHHPGSHIVGKHFMDGSLEEMAETITMELKQAAIQGVQQAVRG